MNLFIISFHEFRKYFKRNYFKNIVFIIRDINLIFCLKCLFFDWRLTKNLVQAQENSYEGKI